MFREVNGTILQAEDKPWSNLTILFELLIGSGGATGLFPSQVIVARTNNEGYFSTKLWVGELTNTTTYKCSYWGTTWLFNLTAGSTPVSIVDLIKLTPTPSLPVTPNREIFRPYYMQTVFQLSRQPTHSQTTFVWLNGVKAKTNTDFIVDGLKLTWFSIPLDSKDIIEVTYD